MRCAVRGKKKEWKHKDRKGDASLEDFHTSKMSTIHPITDTEDALCNYYKQERIRTGD